MASGHELDARIAVVGSGAADVVFKFFGLRGAEGESGFTEDLVFAGVEGTDEFAAESVVKGFEALLRPINR